MSSESYIYGEDMKRQQFLWLQILSVVNFDVILSVRRLLQFGVSAGRFGGFLRPNRQRTATENLSEVLDFETKLIFLVNREDYTENIYIYIYIYICIYTGCPRRNVPDFGTVFLMLKYTDIAQNTYIQSSTVTELMTREKCGCLLCLRTVLCP